MNKTLEMVFQNAAGKNTRISISDPREDLSPAEVQGVMDLIVQKNIFDTTGGDITQALSARIITREVEEIITQS
jgi:hypothetical protein